MAIPSGLEQPYCPGDMPRLMREVRGDFTFTVRVQGDFQTPDRTAGILLMFGEYLVAVMRHGGAKVAEPVSYENERELIALVSMTPGEPAYLRLQRRGSELRMDFSQDGKSWRRRR